MKHGKLPECENRFEKSTMGKVLAALASNLKSRVGELRTCAFAIEMDLIPTGAPDEWGKPRKLE
jgi:hypothetical protein